MSRFLIPLSFLSLILTGAIFGFFYAWVCSTMWGLDQIDPRVSIAAMNGMNASVRNATFAPAFFATPAVLALTTLAALASGQRVVAGLFGAAGVIYFAGGLVLTVTFNVPMNQALMQTTIPNDIEAAQAIWSAYSAPWQNYNVIRTVVSGVSLALVGAALIKLKR